MWFDLHAQCPDFQFGSPASGRARALHRTAHRGVAVDPQRPARRLPRVRAAARRNPNRSTRTLHERSRIARHGARRERPQRLAEREDGAVEVRTRALASRVDSRRRHRPAEDSPAGSGTRDRSREAASHDRAAARHSAAALVHQPRAQDRPLVEDALAARPHRDRDVHGAAEAHVGARRGQRRRLGPTR